MYIYIYVTAYLGKCGPSLPAAAVVRRRNLIVLGLVEYSTDSILIATYLSIFNYSV